MPEFERNGARLAYSVVGDGPSVLMVHSATSSGDHEWGFLSQALSGSFRCVLPDLRGHGSSDHVPGTLGVDQVVEDLRTLIDHEQLGRPHLIGFSFGAEVALEIELGHPGSAASLVLVSPATGHPERVPQTKHMALRWPPSLQQLHTDKHGPDHWRTILDALSSDATTREEIPDAPLGNIACPLLVISGSEDQPIRVAQARRLAELNAGAQLSSVTGAGHAAHKADPDRFIHTVASFLRSADPSGQRGETA
jgi:pimeloyl-ACP methyl ester carboxylesterase